MQSKISGIILAGGKSSRMGTDKGLVMYDGELLIRYAIKYMLPFCDELMISTNNSAYESFGFSLIPDRVKEIGPLGGICSCLNEIHYTKALFTACDTPAIPQEVLKNLCSADPESDMVYLTDNSTRIQPLPLLLDKKTLPLLTEQIAAENYKLQDFISSVIDNKELNSINIGIDTIPKNINFSKDLNS